jgi:hypothetical protein
MLAPLIKERIEDVPYGSDSPTVKCENDQCSAIGPSHLMINCIIFIGSPGHPALPPFQCGQTEHWACSVECWSKVAHACIDEHMSELLKEARATVELHC